MKKLLPFIFSILFILAAGVASAQTIIRVTPIGAGNNSGSSWANAAPGAELQNLINTAGTAYNPNDITTKTQIWVAAGTYVPTNNPVSGSVDDRDKTFLLKNGVALYGGFAGSEVILSARDIANNPTKLSGDLQGDNITSNNSYHVLVSVNTNATAILDGFIIEKGHANGSLNPQISGESIQSNTGGGMYNHNSSAIIFNSTFSGNSTTSGGGAISNFSSSISITNCKFSENGGPYGGAIINILSVPSIKNSIFNENNA
ncbi:MAG: hypothetical protein WBP45_01055, partial [Daejeonella sp.]